MQQLTSTTTDPAAPVGSLWIDRAHHHRLVEVTQIVNPELVRLQPVRDARLHPPSYIESTAQLAAGDYEQVTR